MKKLINNTFCRYMVTDSYETGLKISKESHLNCITMDREVIYSEGYLCKLGGEEKLKESAIEIFEKYYKKLGQISERVYQLFEIN